MSGVYTYVRNVILLYRGITGISSKCRISDLISNFSWYFILFVFLFIVSFLLLSYNKEYFRKKLTKNV